MTTETSPDAPRNNLKLIRIPALISLCVTFLRLTGELRHWSERWFSTETAGTDPHGVSWIVGITWLAAPFGVYFAVRLMRAGQGPRSGGKVLICSVLGLAIIFCSRFLFRIFPGHFPEILIPLWLCWVAAASLQYFAWPGLFKLQLAYGFAARVPVAVVMLLAMAGDWGTHYDYVGMPPQFQMPLVSKYLWLAFFPQVVAWVSYTVVLGMLAASVAFFFMRPRSA